MQNFLLNKCLMLLQTWWMTLHFRCDYSLSYTYRHTHSQTHLSLLPGRVAKSSDSADSEPLLVLLTGLMQVRKTQAKLEAGNACWWGYTMIHNATAVYLGSPGERRIVNTTCSYRRLPEPVTFISTARDRDSTAKIGSRRQLACLKLKLCVDSCESPWRDTLNHLD